MNEWIKGGIEISSAIGAVWAAVAARKSASVSSKQLEQQIIQQEKIDLPRLVPLNTFIQTEVIKMNSDWKKIDSTLINNNVEKEQTPVKELRLKEKFSSYPLPLINTGKMFALDVKYNYVLEGGRDSITEYSFDKIKLKVLDPEKGQLESDEFRFFFYQDYQGYNSNQSIENQIITVKPYVRYIPIIKSEETVDLLIPSYFVLLSNIYIKSNWIHQRKSMKRPCLILTIMYTDQFYQVHTLVYRMALSLKQLRTKGFETEYIETWVDFELIKSEIENKPT
ncbi:hypothetical protein [Exiguobacterium acetylicum]|uniref:hypothetical protein n=1 Tax=Exiguobacterium acetylicum TaxID=41170 RepID=UPI001EE27D6D|nr:hypothetical protein [Exiguobacterium acetylicum]UKS54852.1 hypothetical protein K6T22_09835 [Exiguobacterium acetylicum]